MTPPISPAAPRLAGRREWVGLSVLLLVVLAVSIDNTVLSFAIPHIALDLQPSASMQLWLIDSYPLVLAALLVPMGNLGDRLGRRRLLMIGTFGFAVVSVLAAFAPTAEILLLCRIGLGVFGATLMPCTLSLIRTMFEVRRQRRLAIAIWALGFAAGAAIGPVLGGILLERFHWGSVFLVHLPFVLPLLGLAPFLISESRDPDPGRFDLPSVILSAITITPIAFAVKHAAVHGIDVVSGGTFLLGIAAGWLLVRRLLRQPNPMLDVRLFTYPAFTGSILINLLSVVAMVGLIFFLSQHLQLVMGLTPLDAALVMVPGTIIMIAATLAVVRLTRWFSSRTLVVAGLLAVSVTYVVFAWQGAHLPVSGIAALFAALALGVGVAETLSNDIIMSSVPAAKAGAASAISETSYELGAVIGTSVLGGILTSFYRSNLRVPDGVSPALADEALATLAGALAVAEDLGGEVGDQLAAAAKAAFDSGIVVTSGVGAVLVAAAVALAIFTLRSADDEEPGQSGPGPQGAVAAPTGPPSKADS